MFLDFLQVSYLVHVSIFCASNMVPKGVTFFPTVVACSFPSTSILDGQRAAGQLLNAKKRPTRHFWGETPLAGTNPWLEQNPSWNRPKPGTSSGLEQPSIKLEDE